MGHRARKKDQIAVAAKLIVENAHNVKVLREYQSTDDRNAALLSALRPFLREERRARLDRAQQIARMTRLIRVALTAMGRKEEEGSV